MQLFLTSVGFLLSFAATGIYIVDIVRGNTKPHFYTYLVWSIVTMIAFFGSLAAGGGYGAWVIGITGFLTIVVMLLSLKYGTKDIKPIDTYFLIAACVAILPWLVLKDPLWSVILAVIIDALGYFPTIRKTWKAPRSEIFSPWILGSVKAALALVTLQSFNLTTILFPAEILIMNTVVAYIILARRSVR